MAAAGIGSMGKDSLPILSQCLKDPNTFVRKTAAANFARMEAKGGGSACS